jgi:chaperonin cofactor prefoldin
MDIMNFGSSRRRVRPGSTKMSTSSSSFEGWATKVEDFVSDVRLRLFRVETRLDHIDIRLDRIDIRMDKMDTRLDKIDTRLDKMDARMDERFERMDGRLEQMTASFYREINNLTLRLVTFVCGFGTALVTATYFVITHAK